MTDSWPERTGCGSKPALSAIGPTPRPGSPPECTGEERGNVEPSGRSPLTVPAPMAEDGPLRKGTSPNGRTLQNP
jgi:hypothetical protein